MMAGDADFSGPLMRSVIQGALEGEMAAAISAEKASESRGDWLSKRLLPAQLDHPRLPR